MYEEEVASVNSEMRFITLELMKLAEKKKMSFKEVANEFISNVFVLDGMIKESSMRGVRSRVKQLARKATQKRGIGNR
jgi:hypothetical protein